MSLICLLFQASPYFSQYVYVSREEFFEAIDKHLHGVLALKELNMGSPTDKSIQVVLSDAEIYVDAV